MKRNEQEPLTLPEYTGTKRSDTRIRQNEPDEDQNEAD